MCCAVLCCAVLCCAVLCCVCVALRCVVLYCAEGAVTRRQWPPGCLPTGTGKREGCVSKCTLCASVLLYSRDQCTVALGWCCSADACAWSNRVYWAHCTLCAVLHCLMPCTALHCVCRAALHHVRCTRRTSNTMAHRSGAVGSGTPAMHHWGLFEVMASVRDRARASWKSWPLCGGALGPHRNLGPCVGAHWGFFEGMAPVCERTGASLKSWHLCRIAPGPP